MAGDQLAAQHTRAAAGDELADARRDQLLQEARRQRRAYAGMAHCQPLPIDSDFIDRIEADLAAQIAHDAALSIAADGGDHLVEEAQYCPLRRIRPRDQPARLHDGLRGRVKLQNRVRLFHCLCLPFCRTVAIKTLLLVRGRSASVTVCAVSSAQLPGRIWHLPGAPGVAAGSQGRSLPRS